MSTLTLDQAAVAREERLLDNELDRRIDLLLASTGENPGDRFHAVTANPRSMGYLRFLLRYYSKFPHIWSKCMSDNVKHFGPERAKGLCATVKDTIRQTAAWRHGPPRGPHPGHPDAGAPGVAIAEGDKWAAQPAWHGSRLAETAPCLVAALEQEYGVLDESALDEAVGVLVALGEQCNISRVLLGLDEPPVLKLEAV